MDDDAVFDHPHVTALLELAVTEDVGAGDCTSEATVPETARARGRLLVKEPLVVCGLPLLERVFGRVGGASCTRIAAEGQRARHGDVIAVVEGTARTLLTGERLALNLVQHLCGIATLTRACVEQVAGTGLVIRDTRKTVPGMRLLAKYAVRTGGGTNHRMGLDDAILVKDNHLALGGGDFAAAVAAARREFPQRPLEVEARTLVEVERAVRAQPDLILLDNMSIDDMTAAVRLVDGRVPLEASGGIRIDDLPAVARTGVRYVAMGQLTHSAPAVDLSLKLEPA
ncbi:MAG TPA: carboxylating nicotinate-nucleotide diphosphorylase [Candidatus Binatia bacterium]|nr:carboxylating nicotinate-nucleotide diphosphorylase [Candidatus Binatia bacterium]